MPNTRIHDTEIHEEMVDLSGPIPSEIVDQEVISTDMDILEQEFNNFVDNVERSTSKMTTSINIDELNEMGEDIIKAKSYLESFATGEKKSTREKAFNQLTNFPLIGNWAKDKAEAVQLQTIRDSGVKEVLDGIFDNFTKKKKRLVELTKLAEAIRGSLLTQESELFVYITKLDTVIANTDVASEKMRALDMSIQAQTSDKIIKDQIYNKLEYVIELMSTLMLRMSKTIPALKSQLLNETSIAGMISSIADSVKMMDSLQELTNEIAKTSTKNIQGLIVDVTNTLTDGADIEFYKNSAKTNAEFQQTMIECNTKLIHKTQEAYTTLKNISIDTSNQLEMRADSERKALGMKLESKKEALDTTIEV